MGFLASIMILCVASTAFGARGAYRDDPNIFNVLNYGAKGDGQCDDSNAFLKAWKAACKGVEAGQTAKLLVSAGKSFLVHPLHFQGPCKSAAINFQVLGNITAPTQMDEWQNCECNSWISFSKVDNLTVDGGGSGVINGRGHIWWSKVETHLLLPYDICNSSRICDRPKAMNFLKMKNLEVRGLTHLDSPKAHIRLNKCYFAKLSNLQIIAPEDSPNTDGIAVGASTHIQIHNSTIGTGDDCIAIKGGSSFINITGIRCGPGHGISVGSLGYEGAYETVQEVNVRNCVLKSTQNGARIKTWEGGSGYVRGIHFEDIIISNAWNPIIINQNYCDAQKRSCKVKSPVVKISNVTYRNVRGVSENEPSIKLYCAGGTGCSNIVMDQVDLNSKPKKRSYADCKNVVNASFTCVNPPISCSSS